MQLNSYHSFVKRYRFSDQKSLTWLNFAFHKYVHSSTTKLSSLEPSTSLLSLSLQSKPSITIVNDTEFHKLLHYKAKRWLFHVFCYYMEPFPTHIHVIYYPCLHMTVAVVRNRMHNLCIGLHDITFFTPWYIITHDITILLNITRN